MLSLVHQGICTSSTLLDIVCFSIYLNHLTLSQKWYKTPLPQYQGLLHQTSFLKILWNNAISGYYQHFGLLTRLNIFLLDIQISCSGVLTDLSYFSSSPLCYSSIYSGYSTLCKACHKSFFCSLHIFFQFVAYLVISHIHLFF